MLLTHEEGRVIGSLIEKQLTTPQQYPLSLNALVLACNQSSNRDPVVEFEERTVHDAVASLKTAGLVSFVYPSHGRSVTRYQQLLGEHLAITEQQLALLGVLLLRGPQTAGEMRSRTERMCEFDSIAQVDAELERLSGLPEPLVARLSRRPGQKEERWAQLLTDGSLALASEPEPDVVEAGSNRTDLASEVAELRTEVVELHARVAVLHDELEALRKDLIRVTPLL